MQNHTGECSRALCSHGNFTCKRCKSCISIDSQAKYAVHDMFEHVSDSPSRAMQAHNAAVAHKQALMDRQGSLAAAETELSSLQSQLSALAAAVKDAEARSAKLEQELVESKHRVDVAQARKEEVGLCS